MNRDDDDKNPPSGGGELTPPTKDTPGLRAPELAGPAANQPDIASALKAAAGEPDIQAEGIELDGKPLILIEEFEHLLNYSSYSSPIPPPEVLAGYNEVEPNLVDRIVGMAERQARHRQEMEAIAVRTTSFNSRLGIISALLIALAGLGAATYMVVNGSQVAGAIIGGLDIAGCVSVFVYGTRSRRRKKVRRERSTTGPKPRE